MKSTVSILCATVLAFASYSAIAEEKVSDGVVKIGVLSDFSGIYSDLGGKGSLLAARMAVEDFGLTVLGKPIDIVFGDTQNKPDVAAAKAREWFDNGKVDVVVDLLATNVALAVMEAAAQKNKMTLVTGAASIAITNEKCTANNVHWMYDTHALAVGTAKAMVEQGGDSWFFITADYAFGQALEKDATDVILASGGKVVGSVRHPFPNSSGDFSSFLLKAQASKAKVIGLANGGNDTTNAVKQAAEFGIMSSPQTVVPLLMYITDVHALGLKTARGMYLTEGFYWDQSAKSREWSKRFFDQHKKMPTMNQAGVYSAVWNYLKAVEAAGTDEASAVMKQLKSMTIDDPVIQHGKIREDGRLVHDMLLIQVKKPEESKAVWDYYKVKATIPGNDAFQSLAKSKCSLVKSNTASKE